MLQPPFVDIGQNEGREEGEEIQIEETRGEMVRAGSNACQDGTFGLGIRSVAKPCLVMTVICYVRRRHKEYFRYSQKLGIVGVQ